MPPKKPNRPNRTVANPRNDPLVATEEKSFREELFVIRGGHTKQPYLLWITIGGISMLCTCILAFFAYGFDSYFRLKITKDRTEAVHTRDQVVRAVCSFSYYLTFSEEAGIKPDASTSLSKNYTDNIGELCVLSNLHNTLLPLIGSLALVASLYMLVDRFIHIFQSSKPTPNKTSKINIIVYFFIVPITSILSLTSFTVELILLCKEHVEFDIGRLIFGVCGVLFSAVNGFAWIKLGYIGWKWMINND